MSGMGSYLPPLPYLLRAADQGPAALGLVAVGTGATHFWVAVAPETAWSWGSGFYQLPGDRGAFSASAGFLDKLVRKEPSLTEGLAQGHHLFLDCAYTWTLTH